MKLLELESILHQNPVPDKVQLTTAQRTLFNTFEAFFGQIYFGAASPDENAFGINGVQFARCTYNIYRKFVGRNADTLASVNWQIVWLFK